MQRCDNIPGVLGSPAMTANKQVNFSIISDAQLYTSLSLGAFLGGFPPVQDLGGMRPQTSCWVSLLL